MVRGKLFWGFNRLWFFAVRKKKYIEVEITIVLFRIFFDISIYRFGNKDIYFMINKFIYIFVLTFLIWN